MINLQNTAQVLGLETLSDLKSSFRTVGMEWILNKIVVKAIPVPTTELVQKSPSSPSTQDGNIVVQATVHWQAA